MKGIALISLKLWIKIQESGQPIRQIANKTLKTFREKSSFENDPIWSLIFSPRNWGWGQKSLTSEEILEKKNGVISTVMRLQKWWRGVLEGWGLYCSDEENSKEWTKGWVNSLSGQEEWVRRKKEMHNTKTHHIRVFHCYQSAIRLIVLQNT